MATSSRTDRLRINPPVCSMAPTAPARTASCGERPNTVTAPASGRLSPRIMSMVVVLPAPLGPSKATVSPASMARSMPRTARTTPPCGVLKPLGEPARADTAGGRAGVHAADRA